MLTNRALEKERAARLEAERVSRLKDEFLVTLATELRAPLNSLLGWARLIEAGKLGPEELVRGGKTIARNAQSLARLVDDVLDLGKMVSTKIHLDAEETDFREIVQAAIETIQEFALAKGVSVVQKLESGACVIFGDLLRLQRMVLSLLSNAVKFTPRGGSISIALTVGRSDCVLQVSDSGIGMSAELVPLVFERFTRDLAAADTPPNGLGLGLAIARRIVELHGGTITATSAGKDSGATFAVTLPRLAPRITNEAETL